MFTLWVLKIGETHGNVSDTDVYVSFHPITQSSDLFRLDTSRDLKFVGR